MVIVTVQPGAPEATYPNGDSWNVDMNSGDLDIFRADKRIGTHADDSWTSVYIAGEVQL